LIELDKDLEDFFFSDIFFCVGDFFSVVEDFFLGVLFSEEEEEYPSVLPPHLPQKLNPKINK
jgi:hypothetical protein